MIKAKKINNIEIELLNIKKIKPNEIQGYDYLNEIYSNVFLCARKKSGKTTCIYNLLKNCIGKYIDGEKTKIIFFVGTLNKDDSYKEIFKYLDDNDYEYEKYTSLKDDNGNDILDEFIKNEDRLLLEMELQKEKEKLDKLKKKDKNTQKTYIDPELKYSIKMVKNDDDEIKIKIKKKRPKKIAPKYIIIFDDLSNEIRNNQFVRKLVKENRHFKSKVFISSQSIYDLYPDAREMIDVFILFKNIEEKKLKDIYDKIQCDLNEKTFMTLYNNATGDKNKRDFFYIDTNNCKYRKNFDIELSI